MSDTGDIRVGTAERDAARRTLDEHLRAGRLTADEHAERRAAAAAAVHQSDLDRLFGDLPPIATPVGTIHPADAVAKPAPQDAPPPGRPEVHQHRGFGGLNWWAASGTIALVAFFICGFAFNGWAWCWMFFLIPPVLGQMRGQD